METGTETGEVKEMGFLDNKKEGISEKRLEVGDRLVAFGSWNVAHCDIFYVSESFAIAKDDGFWNHMELVFRRDHKSGNQAMNLRGEGTMGDQTYWEFANDKKRISDGER